MDPNLQIQLMIFTLGGANSLPELNFLKCIPAATSSGNSKTSGRYCFSLVSQIQHSKCNQIIKFS